MGGRRIHGAIDSCCNRCIDEHLALRRGPPKDPALPALMKSTSITMAQSKDSESITPYLLRHIVIGFFTVAPLWVTWLVFDFLFGLLASTSKPLLRGLAQLVKPFSTSLAQWLATPGVQYVLGVLLTLAGFYLIGLFASFVVGKQLINYLETLLLRLPLVQTIYNATKRFLHTMRQRPAAGQRVVLITFPTPGMKAVGFVTKEFIDQTTGQELAAVYVPTAPNPTSGYIEILPVTDLVQTDWTVEEAISFVVTGGTNAPDSVRFSNPVVARNAAPAHSEGAA
jgi:uncharacterized membrane protein